MRTSEEGDRIVRLTFALILVLGVFFRTVAIGREALWGDEALTVLIARLPTFDLFFRPVDPTPGLYYLLHKLFVPVGSGAAATRLVALFFGVLTIPAGYWLGRAALDRRAGLAVAALIAVSPWMLDFSQEARAYSLLVFLVTCSAAALINAFPTKEGEAVRWRMLALSSALGIAAIYTHLVGWFWTAPAALLAAIECDRRGWLGKGALVTGAVTFLIVVAPEFLRLLSYAGSPYNAYNWLNQPDVGTALRIVENILFPIPRLDLIPQGRNISTAVIRAVVIVTIIIWVMLAGLAFVRRRSVAASSRRRMALAAVGVLMSIPVQAFLIGEFLSPILTERTLAPMMPGFFLLIVGLSRLKGGAPVIILAVFGYLAASFSIGFTRHKQTLRESAATIRRAGLSDLPVVACPSWETPAVILALREAKNRAPIIASTPYGQALIAKREEPSPIWQDRYFDLLMRTNIPAYASGPQAPVRKMTVETPSYVVIRGECLGGELRSQLRWMGEGQYELVAAGRPNWSAQIWKFTPTDKRKQLVAVASAP